MINVTELGNSILNSTTSFEATKTIYEEPSIFIPMFLVWGITFILAILIASLVEGRTASGKKTGKLMIQSPNFLWIVLVFILQLGLLFLIKYPVWMILGG